MRLAAKLKRTLSETMSNVTAILIISDAYKVILFNHSHGKTAFFKHGILPLRINCDLDDNMFTTVTTKHPRPQNWAYIRNHLSLSPTQIKKLKIKISQFSQWVECVLLLISATLLYCLMSASESPRGRMTVLHKGLFCGWFAFDPSLESQTAKYICSWSVVLG